MNLALDEEGRAAAFAQVQQLRDQYGGRVPAGERNRGIIVRGERMPFWHQQRGICKLRVFGPAPATVGEFEVATGVIEPPCAIREPCAAEEAVPTEGVVTVAGSAKICLALGTFGSPECFPKRLCNSTVGI